MNKVWALLKGDIRNIRRDFILIASLGAPILLLLFVKLFLPIIAAIVMDRFAFDIYEYSIAIELMVILLIPLMIGTAYGFIILDEKDEGVTKYYSITPLTRKGYLAYRLILPSIISFIYVLILGSMSNVIHLTIIQIIPVAILAVLETPIMALLLASIASNKVEGLAISKGASGFFIAPFIILFIKNHWVHITGILPTYWPIKVYLSILNNNITGAFYFTLMGLFVHLLYIGFLIFRFTKKYD